MATQKAILKNSVLNLLGQIFPLLVGLICIPKIIKQIGLDQFGLLSIIWVAVGYFSLFDFGLGRTVTKLIAENRATNNQHKMSSIFWTSIAFMLAFSLVGTLIINFSAAYVVAELLKIPAELKDDALASIRLLALAIPFVTLLAAVRGALEAFENFKILNILQIFLGAYSFLAPLLVSYYSLHLSSIVLFLLLGRLFFLGLHFFYTLKNYPLLRKFTLYGRADTLELLRYGGWLTVSNIIGPIMVYFDRFILGGLLPVAEIAFYTTPYEMVSRLQLLPSSLTRVLFPVFAKFAATAAQSTRKVYRQNLFLLFITVVIPCLLIFILARWGLTLWLGADFAEKSYRILQVLTVGVLMNCMAFMPLTLIQSTKHPDWIAKLYFVETPLYLFALYYFVHEFGILGAAIAWSLRTTVDALALFALSEKLLRTQN